MSSHRKDEPNPKGDKPSKESPNEPATDPERDRTVSDPHPDTEEGYDRATKVPMTGL
jgi:hypothetical protein